VDPAERQRIDREPLTRSHALDAHQNRRYKPVSRGHITMARATQRPFMQISSSTLLSCTVIPKLRARS
jgi:hypothetical protein